MPVNGIELKEGQIWTSGKRKVTLKKNEGATTYKWKAVYENEEWDTIDENGIYRVIDGVPFVLIQNLIYDPEQFVEKENIMTNKFTPQSGHSVAASLQPGDKIICNNGEEFICCTLEFLRDHGIAKLWEGGNIFGYQETEDSTFAIYDWQYWDEHGKVYYEEWAIREVIPQSVEISADKNEEIKEEPRYTLQEIKEAWDASGWETSTATWNAFRKNLMKNDDGFQEYLRLRAIYE